MRKPFAMAVVLFAWGSLLGAACEPKESKTAAQAAAEASYGAALLHCVDRANTLEESKACRAKVDAAWGVTQKEAGVK